MSDEPFNPLKWREHSAVAHMHLTLAVSKFTSVMRKDSKDLDKTLMDIEKAIECIEASHEAAMEAYDQYAHLIRRSKSVRGVRLTSVRQQKREAYKAMTAPISEMKDSKP